MITWDYSSLQSILCSNLKKKILKKELEKIVNEIQKKKELAEIKVYEKYQSKKDDIDIKIANNGSDMSAPKKELKILKEKRALELINIEVDCFGLLNKKDQIEKELEELNEEISAMTIS